MTMADYFASFKEKWVTVQGTSGTFIFQGVLKEVGDDYIVIQESENDNPKLISNRNIMSFKPMRMKENGKPRMFG